MILNSLIFDYNLWFKFRLYLYVLLLFRLCFTHSHSHWSMLKKNLVWLFSYEIWIENYPIHLANTIYFRKHTRIREKPIFHFVFGHLHNFSFSGEYSDLVKTKISFFFVSLCWLSGFILNQSNSNKLNVVDFLFIVSLQCPISVCVLGIVKDFNSTFRYSLYIVLICMMCKMDIHMCDILFSQLIRCHWIILRNKFSMTPSSTTKLRQSVERIWKITMISCIRII